MDKNVQELYDYFSNSTGISTDTRTISNGNLFFALKGDNFNGNLYAQNALDKGAQLAIVDDPKLKDGAGMYLVSDVLQALQDLARYHRKKLNIPILGITGSNGKTTTKEFVNAVLSTKYRVKATKGNLNNHIGVPLSLLSIKAEDEIAIIEMGTNAPGEIAFLSQLANPTHALITSIGKAHLEGLGSISGVVEEKMSLFSHVHKGEGTLFVNMDDERIERTYPKESKVVKYSTEESEGFEVVVEETYPSIKLFSKYEGLKYVIDSDTYGDYNVTNLIAALTVGHHFDCDMLDMTWALSKYVPKNNRSEKVLFHSTEIFLDAYNANPSSVSAAVKAYGKHSSSKKSLVLGDMLELGEYAEDEHRNIIQLVDNYEWQEVLFVGEIFQSLRKEGKYEFFRDVKAAKSSFLQMVENSSLVLIKGSRGIALEKLIE